MSFPAYSEYKASGAAGLGDIPYEWVTARFSRIMLAIKDGTHGTFKRVAEGRPLLSAKNVYDYGLKINDDESNVSEEDHDEIVSNGFPRKGDLLLTIVGTIGRTCVYTFDYPLAFQRSVCFIRLLQKKSPEFFSYFLQSKFFQEQLVSRSKSAAQGGVYMGDVAATTVAFPPCEDEQKAISSYLDLETSKIDGLVAEQRRLIELLKEKRQAVISHAVTKGLNPNVPMKPSGIQWLGDVPKHWSVQRVKTVSNFVTSGPRGWSELITDNGALFIQSGDLNDALGINFSMSKRVQVDDDAETTRTQLFDGDVVVCVTGAKTGKVAVCTNIPEVAYVNQHLCLVRPNDNMLPKFLGIVLKSEIGLTYFDFSQYGLKQGLSLEDVKNAPVFVPPREEQLEIVDYVDTQAETFSQLQAEAERAIELLQERRTALISAAVTGKIDVREFALQETT